MIGTTNHSQGNNTPEVAMPTATECAICGDAGFCTHEAREMMLGLRTPFTYRECLGCGCLQLVDVPSDMSPFYPNGGYYSFSKDFRVATGWRRALRKVCLSLGGRRLIIRRSYPLVDLILRLTNAKCSSRILDVGCGSGALVRRLRELGFTQAAGIDPFALDDPPCVRRSTVQAIDGIWD